MNDQQTPAEDIQVEPINDSPTFNPVRHIRHLTFQPTAIEIPKKKSKGKGKKKKKASADEGENTPKEGDNTGTPKSEKSEKKKKKTPKHKKKSGGQTPKFGDKAQKLSNQLTFSDVMGASTMIIEPENNKDQALDPDEVALNLPKNEKYNEDIMLGLNITSYLRSKHIPLGNKIFYTTIVAIFIASCIINLWDLVLYATTTCADDFSGVGMYFNFIVILFAKLGVFNYFTSEVNANLNYDLKFPFIIPILAIGVLANLQLPLVLYNYHTCTQRSELLTVSFGYFVVDIAAIIVAIAFVSMILSLIFFQKSRIAAETIKMAKTVLYFLGISAMLLLNALFLFVTFSQTNHFSLTLLLENITYWSLVISGAVIFVLRKKCNITVFRSLPEIDEEQQKMEEQESPKFGGSQVEVVVDKAPEAEKLAEEAQNEAPVEIHIDIPTPLKASALHKAELEKIEEDQENETDNSPTMVTVHAKKRPTEEASSPDTYGNHSFSINCIQIMRVNPKEREENETEEKGI